MWIYNGEEWIEQDATQSVDRAESQPPTWDRFIPELQIVEREDWKRKAPETPAPAPIPAIRGPKIGHA